MTEQDTVNEVEVTEEAATTDAESNEHQAPVNIQADSAVEVETITQEDASYPSPKGAFIFVMLMLTFYVIYWTISYFEIFVFRGA